ncbi:hypothetical protein VTI28DRAFT_1364 [Corynascus sepedonium]
MNSPTQSSGDVCGEHAPEALNHTYRPFRKRPNPFEASQQQRHCVSPESKRMQSCSHTTMAVIYSRLKCMRCGQKPPLGILYRCVTDTEPLIHDANRRGAPVAFDEIGRRFSEKMTLGKFGADARRDALNVLTELPTEQLSSYTLEQLDALISRRENVCLMLRKYLL